MPRKSANRKNRKPGMRRKARKLGVGTVYKYARLNKSLFLQNTATAGNLAPNDVTQIDVPTVASADLIGYQFGAALNFKLDNVQSASDFTNLYDQYRIDKVSVKIIPLSSEATAQSSGYLLVLYWCPDFDDSIRPTAESDLRQKQGVKTLRLDKPRTITINKPKALVSAPITGTTVSAIQSNGWINCTESLVIHNGLKMWFKNVDLRSTATTQTAFRFELMYHLSFKAPQ